MSPTTRRLQHRQQRRHLPRSKLKTKNPVVLRDDGIFCFKGAISYFLVVLGVGMLAAFANLAGFALNVSGQPPQQKKYRLPL